MKSVAIVFGRLNPPTTGHLKLLEALDAQDVDDKILLLSHSTDPAKNPLSYEKKMYFAQKLFAVRFPGIEIKPAPYKTLVEVMQSLYAYDRVVLVAGGDRIAEFQHLLDKYNGNPDKAGNILYSFSDIEVVSAGDRDPDAEDVTGMSASKLRALAHAGDFEGFKLGVPTEDVKLAKELFGAVRRGMNLLEARGLIPPRIREAETPPADTKPDTKAENENTDAIKKITEEQQAAEEKKGASAIRSFLERAKSLPADGGLSRATEDFSGARAQVLLVLADPVTKYHAAVIDQFIRAPVRVPRDGKIPQGTPAYRFIAVVSSKSDIVENAGVRALWLKDLVGSTKNARVMFGKVEAIARTLAARFGYLEFTAQGRVFNKTSSLIVAEWNRAKGSQQTAFALQLNSLGVTTTTFDDPNSAQDALATVDKQLISDISAFKKQADDGSSIATDLEKQISAISDKRKRAFIEELPRGKNIAYLEAIYYAFCALYKQKTGKSLWDLFKSVFAPNIEAVKELGKELGITQGVEAIGKIRDFIKAEPASASAGPTASNVKGEA